MDTVLRAGAAYFTLLLMLRITGRRSGKRMTTFEILLIFLLGGQMTQVIVGEDRSFTNAFLGVSTVALLHSFVAWIKAKFTWIGQIVDGTPLLIYADGRAIDDCMKMVRVSQEDLLASAREEGLESLDKIKYAKIGRAHV